ncbi:MAG: ECF transporter S component [Clostridia bacterium]|nr:ECF transporter S component [Clostridia bacterium]
MKQNLKKLVYAALCLALCMVLPLLTGQIPQIGKALSPMHIPVLLCGFLCGWPWGLAVGAIAPVLRSFIFGMPALYPDAVCMAFELATYGAVSGLLYRVLPRKPWNVYAALLAAMVAGRLVWGLVKWLLLGLAGSAFTMEMFLAGALLNAIPGIILHIVLIPIVVLALEKAGLVENRPKENA